MYHKKKDIYNPKEIVTIIHNQDFISLIVVKLFKNIVVKHGQP
jgi:hypothetical protein